MKRCSKSALARELKISRGMLYYKHRRPETDEALRVLIESVLLKHPGYGHRRVAEELKINRKRARRVMRRYGLKPPRRSKTPRKPLDENKVPQSFPDITRKICPIAPDELWVSDFTFIPFHGAFIYFATILDAFTREVLGLAIMRTHSAELVCRALHMAISGAEKTPAWCHSDQGSEYDSDEYQRILKAHHIGISMSPKASPWRNGKQESFFGRFKVEFGDPERFETLPELMEAIYRAVAYYNSERIHSWHRATPMNAREKWNQNFKRFSTGYQSPPHPLCPPSTACSYRPACAALELA